MNPMAKRKVPPQPEGPSLKSVITSYLIAHARGERRSEDMDQLLRFLRSRRLMTGPDEGLDKLVAAEAKKLEAGEREAEALARLFRPDGRPRPEAYRHGSAFCGRCGMYKDYHKECKYCGKLELSI